MMYEFYKEQLSFFTDEASKLEYEVCSLDFLNNPLVREKYLSYKNCSITIFVSSKTYLDIDKNAYATTKFINLPQRKKVMMSIVEELSNNNKIAVLLHEFSHVAGFITDTIQNTVDDEEIVAEFTTYLLSAKYGLLKDCFNNNGRLLLDYVRTLRPTTEKEQILFEKAKERARFLFNDFFPNLKEIQMT